ncbi:MAG: PASTA domain-containing protein [Bacteroidales bacterium]|jgi:beta-lactam-binding protein with PASTA domain|nr:PASTA domain-containing protein [Bacteroidales bacterium]
MGFGYFFKERKFYLHFLIAIGLSLILFWIVLKSLDAFTKHGQVFLVPDFEGKTLITIKDEGYNDFFTFKIIDSVYFKAREKGSVVTQNPLPGSKVKQGRHVYLTVVAQLPKKVLMPNLKNLSLRQALVTLESKGLEAGELEYIEYFAKNAVIDQLLGEEPIEPDTEISRGTIINLVLGKGDAVTKIPLPFLVGLTTEQAHALLHYHSFNVGKEYYREGFDPVHSKVYKTNPDILSRQLLVLGEKVDLWYRSDELINFEEYVRQFKVDSLRKDSIDYRNFEIENEQ